MYFIFFLMKRKLLYYTILYYTKPYINLLYFVVLCCTVLYNTVSNRTVCYFNALYYVQSPFSLTGSWNASFIVSDTGRSLRDKKAYLVDGNDMAYTYQTFAGEHSLRVVIKDGGASFLYISVYLDVSMKD